MAILKVTAVPDFQELYNKINGLNRRTIKINVDTAAAETTAKSVRQIKQATDQATESTLHYNAALDALLKSRSKDFVNRQNEAAKAIRQIQTEYKNMLAYAKEYSAVAKENAYLTKNLSGKSAEESAAVFGIPPERSINRVLDAQGKVLKSTETIKTATETITNEYGKNGGLVSQTRVYTDEMGNAVTETQQLQKTTHLLGDSLGNIILKMAAWQLLGNAIASVRRAFSDAFKTMKDVDEQLIIVQKTSNATAAELKDIEDQAYESAKAYGTAVDAYLETVSAFSRAGYRDNVTELADLATKTQIVGDMTAETANQFLLSVDKAYQYGGSIEKLTEVLDAADYINNNYATSLSKLAEGLGIVSPVAKQVNVGIDELTAAIGTITAVTQRSGSESARALRALFLNIVGDTKTEIDEGVTWTTGEIAGLQDVIKRYSKDAYEAAQATGKVIDPMEAIAGLAKSMKEGVLSEQELISMVSDIGGKLRSSQLLALVQNWDMYESMLADYKNAAGTADREVELAMNSWSRKQQQLKNEWADFMRQMVDTDAIKNALDLVIGLVEILNTTGGRAIATGLAVSGAIAGIGAAVSALQRAVAALNLAWMAGPLGAILAGVTISTALYTILEKVHRTTSEQLQVIKDLNSEYERQFGMGSEYDVLKSKADALTGAEAARLAVLQAQNDEYEKQIKKETDRAFKLFSLDEGSVEFGETASFRRRKAFSDARFSYATSGDTAGLQSLLKEYAEAYSTIKEYQSLGYELNEDQKIFIEGYEALSEAVNHLVAAQKDAADSTENLGDSVNTTADKFGVAKSVIGGTAEAYKVLDKAQKEVDDQGAISIDTLNTILDKYPELTQYLELTADGYVLTKGALEDYIAAQGKEYEVAYNEAQAACQAIINAENAKGNAVRDTTAAIYEQIYALARAAELAYIEDKTGSGRTIDEAERMWARSNTGKYWIGAIGTANSAISAERKYNTYTALAKTLSIGGTSSGTIGGQRAAAKSSSSSKKTAAQKAEEERLKNLKKAAQQAKKDAKKARDAEIKEIQDQIDALKERNKEEKEALELEKKKEDVLKKQNALLAAQQDRSTRVYNKKTGQWEWAADASKVQKAQEALKTAQENLAEYKRNKAIEEEIEALEKRKKSIKEYYEDVEKRIDDTLEGLEASTTDLTDAFNELGIAVNEYALAEQQKVEAEEAAEEAQSGAGAGSESKGLKPIDGTYTVDPSTGKYLFNSFRRKDDTPDKVVKNGREYPAEDFPDLFDLGGILHGMGGIKATTRDEIVIPPNIAEKMLSPVADQAFAQRMSELNFVYGNGRTPDALMRSGGVGSVVNNSGTTYNLGGVTLTEQQAKTTSVYELAQLAQGLRCYS